MARQRIEGILVTGVGEATGFTTLAWAREAFRACVGIDPHPGTVNLRVEDEVAREGWATVRAAPGILVEPPRADWCNARCYRARIAGGIEAAVVLPEISSYPEDQIELIAPVGVRMTLGVMDGDRIAIEVEFDD
jgi:CTP-dependent riboflavin kinase